MSEKMRKLVVSQIKLTVKNVLTLVGLIAFFLTIGLWLVVAPPTSNAIEYPFVVLLGGAAFLMVLGLAEQIVRECLTLRDLFKQARGKRV